MLLAAGYYQHQGQWRRRAMTNKDNELAKNRPTKRQICIQAIVAADKPEATQEDKDALYKAMRDHPKTMGIFSDVEPIRITTRSRVAMKTERMQGRTTRPYLQRVRRGVLTPQTPVFIATRRDGASFAACRRCSGSTTRCGVVVALAPWPAAKSAPSRPLWLPG